MTNSLQNLRPGGEGTLLSFLPSEDASSCLQQCCVRHPQDIPTRNPCPETKQRNLEASHSKSNVRENKSLKVTIPVRPTALTETTKAKAGKTCMFHRTIYSIMRISYSQAAGFLLPAQADWKVLRLLSQSSWSVNLKQSGRKAGQRLAQL